MRFKLDENLGRTPADVLRSHEHDVETVWSQGLSQATDREVIGVWSHWIWTLATRWFSTRRSTPVLRCCVCRPVLVTRTLWTHVKLWSPV